MTDETPVDELSGAELSLAVAEEVLGRTVCRNPTCEGCDRDTLETVRDYARDPAAASELWDHGLDEVGRNVGGGFTAVAEDYSGDGPTPAIAASRACLAAARVAEWARRHALDQRGPIH